MFSSDRCKGFLVLTGVAVSIVLSIVGLARVTIGDDPAERDVDVQARETSDDGSTTTAPDTTAGTEAEGPFPAIVLGPPERLGGALAVTGDRRGEFAFDDRLEGPSYGLGGDQGRVFFALEGDTLLVDQIAWEGLDFFFDPNDCRLEPDVSDAEVGLARVSIECVDVTDIRATATVTFDGAADLPYDMVHDRDLPRPGATVEVTGALATTWVFEPTYWGIEAGDFDVEAPVLIGRDARIAFEAVGERLVVSRIHHAGVDSEVPPEACSVEISALAQVDPATTLDEVRFRCEGVAVTDVGTVDLDGSAVLLHGRESCLDAFICR